MKAATTEELGAAPGTAGRKAVAAWPHTPGTPHRTWSRNGASADGLEWRAIAGDIGLGVARESDSGISGAVAAAELQDALQLELCSVLQLASNGRLDLIAEAGPGAPSAPSRDPDQGAIGIALRETRCAKAGPPTEVAAPLIVGGRIWGVILCIAGPRGVDEMDAELIARVAEHVSAAMRTTDLYERLKESMIGTAEALAAALAAKDSYTADHARSIADLAGDVGRELGLSATAVEEVRYGGIFHDVGKIAIPDAILNKPGPLTDEEFEVIRQHPAIGAEILAPVPFLYGVRTIVRHAHEHWDGSGYPDGLTGERIPLGARIVLAVDAYHAMTSDRPYRAAMSHEEACRELSDGAGTQFDPKVVEVLLAVLSRRAGTPDTSS